MSVLSRANNKSRVQKLKNSKEELIQVMTVNIKNDMKNSTYAGIDYKLMANLQ